MPATLASRWTFRALSSSRPSRAPRMTICTSASASGCASSAVPRASTRGRSKRSSPKTPTRRGDPMSFVRDREHGTGRHDEESSSRPCLSSSVPCWPPRRKAATRCARNERSHTANRSIAAAVQAAVALGNRAAQPLRWPLRAAARAGRAHARQRDLFPLSCLVCLPGSLIWPAAHDGGPGRLRSCTTDMTRSAPATPTSP